MMLYHFFLLLFNNISQLLAVNFPNIVTNGNRKITAISSNAVKQKKNQAITKWWRKQIKMRVRCQQASQPGLGDVGLSVRQLAGWYYSNSRQTFVRMRAYTLGSNCCKLVELLLLLSMMMMVSGVFISLAVCAKLY